MAKIGTNDMICVFCNTPLPQQSRFCAVCGASLSDPELTTRQRMAVKELFDAVKLAVEGHYRVSEMLGRGGMGAVFLAEDLRLGRMVAIKVLRPELAEDAASVARFQREVRIAARLDHPNIIPVYAVEEVGDLHYFVMKYMAGKSLDELLAGKPLPVEQGRRILWQAARGLGHAHQRGVIHRDIKPSNIMVDEDSHVVITDFGISKALHAKTQYTSTGQMLGTPQYLSPEQARDLPVDGRSDQYSLAVVGYQMLVGVPPLVAETVHALLYKHIYEVPTPARATRPEVPADLSDALERALSKNPEDRFATMEDFAGAIESEGVKEKRPITPAEGAEPETSRSGSQVTSTETVDLGRRRRRAAAFRIALAAIAVTGVIALALRMRGREAPVVGELQTGQRIPETQPSSADSPPREVAPGTGPAATQPSPDTTAPDSIPISKPAAKAVSRSTPPRRKTSLPPAAPRTGASDTGAVSSATVSTTGFLTINANPYGTVSIDGIDVGDTPIVRHELAPGEHKIQIAREGFRTESTTVTITPKNEIRLSRTLVKATP